MFTFDRKTHSPAGHAPVSELRSRHPAAPSLAALPAILRKCDACEDEQEMIQRVPSAHSDAALDTEAAARATERGGEPLPKDVRSFFEPRFGHDFSAVRVHADGEAAKAARSIDAHAYTLGNHIVFGQGAYAPHAAEGRSTLAHELTHVVQQGGAAPGGASALSSPSDPAEHEAEAVATETGHAAPGTLPVLQRMRPGVIHRQHVHMASGRFVGDRAGPENNKREEVLDVIDRLARLDAITQPDYQTEYSAVQGLAAASSVPAATIPKTIAGIRTAENPVLQALAAQQTLGLSLTADVGRSQPNATSDILSLQDQLHAEWHLSNSDYSTERAAVNAVAASASIPDGTIPKTIDGITKQKLAILAGNTGTPYRHQLAVSQRMQGLVGQTATWTPSGPGSGNTFETWASAATEAAAGPLPAVVGATRINCWEMVLVAALQSGLINWAWVHSLYTSSLGPGWGTHLVNTLTRGTRTPYDVSSPNTPRPNRGQVVFFNGASHVSLANGVVDGSGRAQIWTFWPPPGTPFTPGGTVDQVKLSTIEELSTWMATNFGTAPRVDFSLPPW